MPLRLLLLDNQVGISGKGIICPIDGDSRRVDKESPLSSLLGWKSGFHPSLLSLRIMRHVGVTHRRQFTGGVFAGMSMPVCAVGDDLSVLVGQQLRGDFLDAFWRNVQGAGDMGFAVAFRSEGLDQRDALLSVELGFQVFGRDCTFHCDLLENQATPRAAQRKRALQCSPQMVRARI